MSVRLRSTTAVIFAAVLAAAPAMAAQGGAARRGGAAAPAAPGAVSNGVVPGDPGDPRIVLAGDETARETKDRLSRLFRQYPPTLAEVLRRDPSLLHNDAYLAPYPGLAAFLGQHPEVAHNPAFFLDTQLLRDYAERDPTSEKARAIRDIFSSFTLLLGFMSFFGLFGWVIKALVDHRRWTRMSKVQTDAHSKFIDRLTSNEDLLAYIQTPAGQRYLESAPLPLHAAGAMTSAPYSRILWSVQVGTVAVFVGLGFLFVSGRWALETDWSGDFSRVLLLMGVLVLAAGVGFVLSGLVSYILSRRLGLIQGPSTSHA